MNFVIGMSGVSSVGSVNSKTICVMNSFSKTLSRHLACVSSVVLSLGTWAR